MEQQFFHGNQLINRNNNFLFIPKYLILIILGGSLIFISCKKKGCTDPNSLNYDENAQVDDGTCEYNNYNPTPYELSIPPLFNQYILPPLIPLENPTTIEGVQLGRKLFYDPILSGDNSQSCASCHNQSNAFTDPNQFSSGIDGILGSRNAMPIFNVAWNYDENFFWDGRASSVENQAFSPVTNPIEMHETWPNAVDKIQNHNEYPGLFYQAFGTEIIDSILVTKAIAQFERTLISSNSKFDKFLNNEISLSPSEISGFNIFMDENGGDCFHCHGDPTNPLWTDNLFHNNGLDAAFIDEGLGAISGNPNDIGKFKTPSLRNLIFTAPYMHDGRFSTLDEVIMHYSTGLVFSSTIDPLMKNISQGGAQLNPQEIIDLKSFLLTLTDSSFISNPNFSQP